MTGAIQLPMMRKPHCARCSKGGGSNTGMQSSVVPSSRPSCPVNQTLGVARHLDSIDRSLSPSDTGPLEAMEHEAQGEGSRLLEGKDAADPAVVETLRSIARRMAGHYAAASASFREDQRERGIFPCEDSGL